MTKIHVSSIYEALIGADGRKELVADANVNGLETLFNHGSRTVRVDFHLHTKVDKEFNYEKDDSKFCQDYVQRLVEEDISVGVITNHNKFDFEEFKALRKTARKRGILLLPGVELSVNVALMEYTHL